MTELQVWSEFEFELWFFKRLLIIHLDKIQYADGMLTRKSCQLINFRFVGWSLISVTSVPSKHQVTLELLLLGTGGLLRHNT